MARLPSTIVAWRLGCRVAAMVCAGIMLAGAGCANRIYTPSQLPAEFLATSAYDGQMVDLSRLAHMAVSQEMIDRGDVLDVTIATDSSELPRTTSPVRVGEDGIARIPVIGPVPIAGLRLPEAEQAIAATSIERGVFRNPHVTLSMKQQRRNRVTVIGAVKEPGVYELARGNSSLLAALVQAGGLTEEAGAEVEIRHGLQTPDALERQPAAQVADATTGQVQQASYQTAAPAAPPIVCVNLINTADQPPQSQSLGDGDVIVVAKRTPQPIFVMGLVQKPGEFHLPPSQDLHVLDALALAGGRTMELADKVIIRRQARGREEPVVIEVSVRKAKRNAVDNVRLAEGDIVSVEQTPVTVLADAVRSFVRIAVGGSVAVF